MGLAVQTINEVGRLLNGKNNPHECAIGHLALSAARTAESLIYLSEIDNHRFDSQWPDDNHANDVIDDAHVRWASTSALTCVDLCIAAVVKLSIAEDEELRKFIENKYKQVSDKQVSIRDFYCEESKTGKVIDHRDKAPEQSRLWIDNLIDDSNYHTLLKVRNALTHGDMVRNIYGTTDALSGHDLRFGYYIGTLKSPVPNSTHELIRSRQIIELSRDFSIKHFAEFLNVLKNM